MGLVACREDIRVVPFPVDIAYRNGFYILCEGNMGSNKATIDFYDSDADTLYMNIYPAYDDTYTKPSAATIERQFGILISAIWQQ